MEKWADGGRTGYRVVFVCPPRRDAFPCPPRRDALRDAFRDVVGDGLLGGLNGAEA